MSDMQGDNVRGKICLVTGASSGVGKVTATALAKAGATVVGVARDSERARAALEEIRRDSGNASVDFIYADLSLQSGVREAAAAFLARHDRLHVLVNNAGAAFPKRELTADGIERTFALNHMGYFLLTQLLLDTLRASAPARVISVASVGHKAWRRGEFDALLETGYGEFKAYAQSKLANILFTRELARRLEGSGVVANCLHPGGVNTNIWFANQSFFAKMVGHLGALFMISAEEGADTMIWLATAAEGGTVSGEYFYKRKARRTTTFGSDMALAGRLWTLSESLVKPA